MEWTELQVLMVVLECVKRHPQILRIFKSLPFQCQQDIIPTDSGAVGVKNERQAWSWKDFNACSVVFILPLFPFRPVVGNRFIL